ncbi:zinc ABC transporter ATP-binding protein AztA [Actinoalloteichus hymeniacidonis]|uniref:ATPase component of Mn/Zn ABC-type transporter n=1 Tax=Actinoalloteichus hymeniacidonis TaxID=340345 RepID=A0AAC9HU87_9PSEU|nr:zinc ABC transporter ATP-binding protein AztA [Actinoalloteichus hymeniacidonis]AOS64610.1 ATPase component of Mn/Zn ABC-type transporter [Actinoalloteichus hymeniacidonis]MBB5907317.1 zinc/manganese transport system ATP-binding protein [Actinoalloteichus hymeniacidonis]
MPQITLSEVSASYGAHQVLHEVSAEIPRSRITAVVGANGAGKSSLLNVIAGILPTSSGTVTRRDSRRPAYVVQRSAVSDTLPITVRATVEMGRWAQRGPWRRLTRDDRAIVEDCLVRLDIHDLADRRLGALSGGQRQRALVAQGLAQRSEVLLLDEPAAGLDMTARNRIDEALRETAEAGTTVLRVTHDLAVARASDHCLLLHGGSLVAQGEPAEVLTEERVRTAWDVPSLW